MLFAEPSETQADLHFSLFGIPVRVHPFFWLITAMFAMSGQQVAKPDRVLLWVIVVFVSILVHELGHAFAARWYGWPPRITLHGMGGLAIYRPTYHDPRVQIFISFAGPLAGFLLAGLVAAIVFPLGVEVVPVLGRPMGIMLYAEPDPDGALMTFLKTDTARLRAILFIDYLLYVNVMWGLVNLLPIFPLDGGNIAREFLTITRPRDALRISLWLSVFTAGLMAAYVGIQLKQVFLALFFGYLAYTSYTAVQAYFGPGGGYGGGEQRWR